MTLFDTIVWNRKAAVYVPEGAWEEVLDRSGGRIRLKGDTPEELRHAIRDFAMGTMTAVGQAAEADGGTGPARFRHPLCSKPIDVPAAPQGRSPMESAVAKLLDKASDRLPDCRALATNLWRYGREMVPGQEMRPAVPSLPDFTIWNLRAAESALMACADEGGQLKPAMLLFQLGPVQEFIAQARSTRDLWSGSYLLSWLIAHAIRAVTSELGGEAVFLPNLCGNSLMDAISKGDLLPPGTLGLDTKRYSRDEQNMRKLTPTLPNRFLALVPEEKAEELAKKAERAVRAELHQIAERVWVWVAQHLEMDHEGNIDGWKHRWDAQVESFPQVTWAYLPWMDETECLTALERLPGELHRTVATQTRTLLCAAENASPAARSGILWSAHYALVDARLAARRNTRDFFAWESCPVGDGSFQKDSLSGKEEAIGGDNFWERLVDMYPKLFTAPKHRYGAMNLIKRLWCRGAIAEKDGPGMLWSRLGMSSGELEQTLHYDDTRELAGTRKYLAVLSMDGDEMGKWLSGDKTPLLKEQMATTAFSRLGVPEDTKRLLTPAYHLQFSEALSNYALFRAREIVEAPEYDGQLIYAGGDDVLAMLPATTAVQCAQALRNEFGKASFPDAYSTSILPGTKTTASIGLAIGHHKAPLQAIIQESRWAEHRAKSSCNRDAIAFTLDKRSGEIIQWGCKWSSGALELMDILAELMKRDSERDGSDAPAGALSKRFPYVLARQLAQYSLEKGCDIDQAVMRNIMEAELDITQERQGAGLEEDAQQKLAQACKAWLKSCPKLEEFIMPFLTESFINREEKED